MEEGKEHKGRIVTKLFYEKSTLAKIKFFNVSIAIFQVIYFNIWTKGDACTLTA